MKKQEFKYSKPVRKDDLPHSLENRKQPEDIVIDILTDKKLSTLKTMIEKNHALDCILLLILGKGQWKNAQRFMKKLNLRISDGTFRARMREIESNQIASHENIDVKKKRWIITSFGKEIGKMLLDFFSSVKERELVNFGKTEQHD